jgi:ketosteroid isomerase-like protein
MKKMLVFSLICMMTAGVFAQSKDEQQVSQAVDQLVKAMLDGDSTTLARLTHQSLVYGHSSGKMESQNEFISALASGASDFKSLEASNQSISVHGNMALVRHNLKGDVVDNGKAAAINLGVLLVWQKSKKDWKLLARQAFKL